MADAQLVFDQKDQSLNNQNLMKGDIAVIEEYLDNQDQMNYQSLITQDMKLYKSILPIKRKIPFWGLQEVLWESS